MSDQHRATPPGALGRWRTRRVARSAEATSKHAEAIDKEAQAIERRTQALRNHHALTTALGVKDQPTTGDRELSTADRVAIAATSVIVLAITSVIMLVIIGAQIAFYAKSLGEYRYVAELDWLPGVDNEQGLDLAFFTPFATEGVVWACTLMAVVLVMLNRKSDAWTRAMWFFASIQAVVNTVHALDMDDLAGAFVKGGLSLAGPFVVHLFILWVRHVRTGRTLAQARQHSANRWRQRAKRVRLVLRTITAHLLHPRVAFGALSIYVGARHLTYDQAWFIAAHPYRVRIRSRYIASEAKARAAEAHTPDAAEALGEQGAHALAEPTDEQGARETSPAEHDRSPEQQAPPLTLAEPSAAGVLATDTIAVPGLGSQADDDEIERALFAQLEAEFAARDERSPNCSPDCSPTCDGECSHPLTSASTGEHPDASTPEHPGERPGERSRAPRRQPGERSRAPRRAPRRAPAASTPASTREHASEKGASTGEHTDASTGERSPASTGERSPASTGKTDKERVIERYWALYHAGLLDTVNQTELAHQMGIRPSSFRRTWAECVKGKHLDPNQPATTEPGKENHR